MPQTINEALALLEKYSQELEEVMGSEAIGHYLRVKRAEASNLHDMDSQEARKLLVELF
jgi:glutamine synthetase